MQKNSIIQEMKRGAYGEIVLSSVPYSTRKQIQNLFNAACKSEKVDEHGNWEFGMEFDRKGRGYAINWDLYAFGKDFHNKRLLIIIQIRKFERRRVSGFGNVQKSYFLIGRNEDNTVFAHPVESRVIHSAIKRNDNIIRCVQDWIFSADYRKILRHGDIAAVPVSKPQGEEISTNEMIISPEDGSGSHLLKCNKVKVNGNVYALNPHLSHLPGTHPDVAAKGWYKIVIGRRTDFYSFAAPTID